MTKRFRLLEPHAPSRNTLCVITALLLALLAAGCSSSSPKTSNAQTQYKNAQYRFSLTYPSGLLEERSPGEVGHVPKGETCVCFLRVPGLLTNRLDVAVLVAAAPRDLSHLTRAQLEYGAQAWMQGAQRVAPATWSHFSSKVTRLGGRPAICLEFEVGDGAKMSLYHVYRRDLIYQVQAQYTTGAAGTELQAQRVINSFRLF
jgi:hypothetical protein